MAFFIVIFHREREGRGNRVWLLRRQVYGPRAHDHVAQRRPDGRQIPVHLPICLLRVEPCQAG